MYPPPPAVAQCFFQFSGMTCADSASWVQAIGTIVAVAASAVIAFGVHFSERRSAAKADKALRLNAARMCLMLASGVRACLAAMIQAAQSGDAAKYSRSRAMVADSMSWSFPEGFALLPSGLAVAYLGLRGAGAQILTEMDNLALATNPQHIAGRLTEIVAYADARRAEFDAALAKLGIDPTSPIV